MSDNKNNPQLNELVSFIQHDLPGLDDGKYKLEVSQEIISDDKTISDESLTTSYKFGVTGDRFYLAKPSELLNSVFPAENATGKFNTVLPSVVFNKSTFPWTRYPSNKFENPGPGKDVEGDVATWLTVILLDEEDIANYKEKFPKFSLEPAVATIGDLFIKEANPSSTLDDNYSYFRKVTSSNPPLSTYMDPGDKIGDKIQVIDIPCELFFKIAPTIEDLKLMAHVRKVSLINKPTIPGISDVGEPVGSFSIVFGNRLPIPIKKTYAYLVSLEELEDFLPTNEEGGPPSVGGFKPDPSKMIRLAVLKSWNFVSTGESATFVKQLNALNGAKADVPPLPPDPTPPAKLPPVIVNKDLSANTNLILKPAKDALPIVKNALEMGFVPLNHDLRAAETSDGFKIDKTVSWYRGPLVPYQVKEASISLPISSPDEVTIFDPTTGMFNTSYAAAWTLGRQLALQDPNYSIALYNWKKGLSQQIINNVEENILDEYFSTVYTPSKQLDQSNNGSVRREIMRKTILSLYKSEK